jgi:hypothetical protein
MLVEIATGFGLFLGFERVDARRLTMSKTIGIRLLFVLPTPGALPYRSKID